MDLITAFSDRVASLCNLLGEGVVAEELPAAVAALSNAEVVALIEAASRVEQLAERVRIAAVGVVSARSRHEAGHSGIAQSRGYRSTVAFVQELTGATRADAARQVRVAESLFETSTPHEGPDDRGGLGPDPGSPGSTAPSGLADPAPAQCLQWHTPLDRALLTGALSTAQHDAIRRGLGTPPAPSAERDQSPLPDGVTVPGPGGPDPATPHPQSADPDALAAVLAAWQTAAEDLIVEAENRTVEDLAKTARAIRDYLDPAGAEARYSARYEARSFRIWTDRNGHHHAHLVCDDTGAAWLRSIRDTALRPRRGGPRFVAADEQARAKQLIDDPRSNDQLAYDLFLDLTRTGALATPDTAYGTRQAGVRLVQIVDSDRAAGFGYFEDDPSPVPAGVVEQQACTNGITPVTATVDGRPLDVGREQRLYTTRQRIALAIRDGGCRWPGCDRPPAYCEAHHIDHWHADDGRTDLDRGISLCRFHHMQLHNNHWKITRDRGRPDRPPGPFILHPPPGTRPPGRSSPAQCPPAQCPPAQDPTDRTPTEQSPTGQSPTEQYEMPPRLALTYAWAGIEAPPRAFPQAA